MATRIPIREGEWYHCYNRGVDRRVVFEDARDHERFLLLLFLSNGTRTVHISDFKKWSLKHFLATDEISRGEPIVELGAYALMPNHVHLVVQEIQEGGMATFMQRLFTGYTMYFNTKRRRTGSLFSGTYKAKHVHSDQYLQMVVPYVLLNPAALFDADWKHGNAIVPQVWQNLQEYPYTSLPEFLGEKRLEGKIVGTKLPTYFERIPTLEEMIRNAEEYYLEHRSAFSQSHRA